MRLAALFLGVLAASVLLASLAAWGITYGTSSSRVTLMSSDFTAIAGLAVDQFQAFVSDLLLGNANLVNAILAEERESGEARLQEAQATMVRTTGTLVNYTANATDQSQAQVNAVVDTFASLMGSVVVDFKGVATGYAGQLRAALAAKASTALLQTLTTRNATMLRFQMLYSMGLLNLSKAPWEPIGLDDCTLLGVLCAATLEMSTAEPVTIALATGRSYTCQTGQEASVTRLILNGTQYTQQSLEVAAGQHRLGDEAALFYEVACRRHAGPELHAAPGVRVRAGPAVRNVVHRPRRGRPPESHQRGRVPTALRRPRHLHLVLPLQSRRGAGPHRGGVQQPRLRRHRRLPGSHGHVAGTTLVNVHNDTYLSVVGTTGAKCAANATPPGDTSIPTWSGLRSCDPGLRAVCQWLAEHRGAMPAAVSLNISDVVWDVFLTDLGFMAYYVIVGTPLAVINAAVDASDARTAAQLTVVRAEQLSVVAASGSATKAYMAAVGAENVHASQGMQQTFAAQIQALENSSKETLAVSQRHSATQVAELTQRQTTEISLVTARHLSAMAVTTGWTLGVVFGILLGVLLCSAWGTVRLTLSLANIIHLMEDVADMRVEDLVVPQHARVAEVARIEAAFQVLVRRLVQYKSYIPAGVFEQMRREEAAAQPPVNESEAEGPSVSDRTSMRRLSSPVRDGKARGPVSPAAHGTLGTMHALRSPGGSSPGSSASGRNPAAHRVAALCFHAFDLTGHVVLMPPAQAKALLSQYTVLVHEAVSQNRGNVDFLAGDQAVVTFNAHIPCADPGAAAVNAACEMRRLLQQSEQSECLRFQIGIAFGPVLAGSVGYAKFRSMVTLGIPMKIAAMISQMSGFDSGTILADASVEERLKYAYELHPADLVHFPQSQTLDNTLKRRTVFLVQAKRQMDEDEWLYQLGTAPVTEWAETFERIAAAPAAEEAQGHLERFLAAHPRDPVALRLKGRLAAWTPGLGLPLWDRAEHAEAGKPPALPK